MTVLQQLGVVAVATVAAAHAITEYNDTPWPLPTDCKVTDPQIAYSKASNFQTFADPDTPTNFSLFLGGSQSTPSFLATRYPDPLGLHGNVTRLKQASGHVQLDTATGKGSIFAQFQLEESVDIGRMGYDKGLRGNIEIVSTDFNGWGGRLVPFQHQTSGYRERSVPTGGMSANIIQHGCSGQGEPGFPRLNSRASTWGHGDVYENGKLKYKNVWLHTMYTERYRDPKTGAVYADDEHKTFFSPKKCHGKAHYPAGEMEFSLVVARWCHDPTPGKIHPQTDMDMLLSFSVREA